MKKVIMFFLGFCLLLLSFATLYFASILYTTYDKTKINSFIFQTDDLSVNRIEQPVPAETLSDKMEERLIRKFVTEYFYVLPDAEDLATRTRNDSILAALSAPDVFKAWKKSVAPDIQKMADDKMLRTVSIEKEIPKRGDYWEVYYELKTWEKPNIMSTEPKKEKGVIYLKTNFKQGLREKQGGNNFDIQKYIQDGGDPAALFKFMVTEIK